MIQFQFSQAKQKNSPLDCSFVLVAGMGFEPHDLRVMSPTSYQAALPRDMENECLRLTVWCRKPGSNRYDTHVSRDFKSRASANSAIPAFHTRVYPPDRVLLIGSPNYYTPKRGVCQPFFSQKANIFSSSPFLIGQIATPKPSVRAKSRGGLLGKRALFFLFSACRSFALDRGRGRGIAFRQSYNTVHGE